MPLRSCPPAFAVSTAFKKAMQITNNSQTSSIQGNYSVESKPLTDSEAKAKAQAVQDQNLQAIEGGLKQNSAGWGDKVKIKVPADSSGRAI